MQTTQKINGPGTYNNNKKKRKTAAMHNCCVLQISAAFSYTFLICFTWSVNCVLWRIIGAVV